MTVIQYKAPRFLLTGTYLERLWRMSGTLVRNNTTDVLPISVDPEALDGQLVTGSLKPCSSTTFLVQFLRNPHTSLSIQGGTCLACRIVIR